MIICCLCIHEIHMLLLKSVNNYHKLLYVILSLVDCTCCHMTDIT